MRLKDAIGTIRKNKKKRELTPLVTVWTEQADDRTSIPLAEYPRPQMQRRDWICLNGWWDYAITGRKDKFSEPDGQILVPFSPETARSAVRRTLMPGEALWYRREIILPEMQPANRLLLHFGAVDERCTVWCNGVKLGRHRGGYLPFTFDITEHVSAGRNILLVRVLDDTDRSEACRGKQKLSPGGMFYTAQSGIWQTVWMERVPEVFIRKMQITPDISRGEISVRILADRAADGFIEIGCPGTWPEEKEIRADTADGCISGGRPAQRVRFRAADFDEDGRVSCIARIQAPVLWSPESPVLYPLRIRLGEDEVSSYFAMRSFGKGKDAAGRPCLMLNGEPYFFNGVLDQGYWPESLMTEPSDEAMCFDIRQMKKLGFNMLRKHVKVEPLRWYYHCDRIGMAVWQDMVCGGGELNSLLVTYAPTVAPPFGRLLSDCHYHLFSRDDGGERERFEEQLTGMIDLLYNVPCISLWVIFNEGWGQFDAARLTELVRHADPTRLIDHASGWFDQGAGDVRSIHNYFRTLKVEEDPYGRPCVLSEYGGAACCIPGHYSAESTYGYHNEEPETFAEKFRSQMEEIRRLGAEGLAAAVYTQVSDIEEEVNGLLTYDRKVNKG